MNARLVNSSTSLFHRVKSSMYLILILVAVGMVANVLVSPPKTVEAVTGGPACSTWAASFYGIDDTATIAAGQNPYGNPGIGYTGPSRKQIQLSASTYVSTSLSTCAQPRPMPAVITTNNCAAGSSSCPIAPQQFGGSTDADKISMYPPSTVVNGGITLTYIGTSYEAGTAGYAKLTNGRNFPSNAQVGSLNTGFRLIFHYVNCSDPSAASYCPAPPPPPPPP
nr:hypothetical protein [Candidatus Saccharibacteria bacterium]